MPSWYDFVRSFTRRPFQEIFIILPCEIFVQRLFQRWAVWSSNEMMQLFYSSYVKVEVCNTF